MPSLKNGFFWYKDEATYIRFRTVLSDEKLGQPYEEWRKEAEQLIESAAKKGMFLIKINADPDEFLGWCEINSRAPDRRARMVFAAQKAWEKIGNG